MMCSGGLLPVKSCFAEDVLLRQTLSARQLNNLFHRFKLSIVAGSDREYYTQIRITITAA